jgi:peptidoglycan hydrolase-like protein with peptidoglycan-binding domain
VLFILKYLLWYIDNIRNYSRRKTKKKKIALLLAALVLCSVSAFAVPFTVVQPTDLQPIDLDKMTVAELETLVADALARIDELTPKPAPDLYTAYEKGSKGDGVKAIQARLIELKYLSGTADGSYGNMTVQAVTDYQKVEGLKPTGIADSKTQEMMFSTLAKENPNPPFNPSAYEKLNYNAVARDPDAFKSNLVMLTGKVLQVIEGDAETQYRIATKGKYDDVVLVSYIRPDGASRVLEDDEVTVYGLCLGVISYKSTMGGTITIPAVFASKIEIK